MILLICAVLIARASAQLDTECKWRQNISGMRDTTFLLCLPIGYCSLNDIRWMPTNESLDLVRIRLFVADKPVTDSVAKISRVPLVFAHDFDVPLRTDSRAGANSSSFAKKIRRERAIQLSKLQPRLLYLSL